VVSLVAELRGHERQAVAELQQWKTHHEERKSLDASPAAITLALLLTDEELDSLEKGAGDGEIARHGRPGGADVASPQPAARHSEPAHVVPRQCRGVRRATADGWGDPRESDPSPAHRPRADPRPAGSGMADLVPAGLLGARLTGQGSRQAGDAHRHWRGLAGRRTARPRAAGRRGVGSGRRASRSPSPSTPRRRRTRSPCC
jgi:hypothetical protein